MIKKLDDLIYIKENALDKEFCDHCIEKFKSDERRSQGKTGGGLNLNVKRSIDLCISYLDDWAEEDKVFFDSLNKNLFEYINLESSKAMDLHTVNFKDTGYQIQETKPEEFYHWHTDYMVSSEGKSRILTFIWYLNDIKYKGETEFITGTKIKPETGKLILFPAAWMYYHRGCPPKKEVKYITTGWLYYNVKDPNFNLENQHLGITDD